MAVQSPLTQAILTKLISLNPGFLGFGVHGEILDVEQGILLALVTISQQLSQGASATTPGTTVQPLPQPQTPTSATPTSPFQSVDLTISEGITKNSAFGNFTAPFDGSAVLTITLSGGGTLSVVEQKPSGRSTAPETMYGATKLQANQRYDIPLGITSGNKYYFQSDTAGSSSWQVVSYNMPMALFPFTSTSSGGGTGVVATDVLISTTGATTVLTYTVGTSDEALEAVFSDTIITGAVVLTVVLSWTDPNTGAETFYWEKGGSVPVGPHSYDVYAFTGAANSTVSITVTAGTTNQVYVSCSIEKQV